MPRQPFLKVVPKPTGNYTVGGGCLGKRPELEALIAHCLMLWPTVEAEMSILLGFLLGAENAAARAVFQSLRRSQGQRDAIAEAAKAALSMKHQELVNAVLGVHKSIEIERNVLAHGHFGVAEAIPDALIWQSTNDYVALQTEMALVPGVKWDKEKHLRMLESFWVYRKPDLAKTLENIQELGATWNSLFNYLKTPTDQAYNQLSGQPRVAQELANIRRKNNPLAQPLGPEPQPTE